MICGLLSWLCLGGSLGASWGLKANAKRSFGNSGCQLEPVLSPKEPPGHPQMFQNEPKRHPKAPSRASLNAKPRCIKNVGFPSVKSRFLRVGELAWELKIDAERLQDKENDD